MRERVRVHGPPRVAPPPARQRAVPVPVPPRRLVRPCVPGCRRTRRIDDPCFGASESVPAARRLRITRGPLACVHLGSGRRSESRGFSRVGSRRPSRSASRGRGSSERSAMLAADGMGTGSRRPVNYRLGKRLTRKAVGVGPGAGGVAGAAAAGAARAAPQRPGFDLC